MTDIAETSVTATRQQHEAIPYDEYGRGGWLIGRPLFFPYLPVRY